MNLETQERLTRRAIAHEVRAEETDVRRVTVKVSRAGAEGLTIVELEAVAGIAPTRVDLALAEAVEQGLIEEKAGRYCVTEAWRAREVERVKEGERQAEAARHQQREVAVAMALHAARQETTYVGEHVLAASKALGEPVEAFSSNGGTYCLSLHPLRVTCIHCGRVTMIGPARIPAQHAEGCAHVATKAALAEAQSEVA